MFRNHVPDLDILESPVISASPFGSILGVMPGSALADKIFNDPESWQGPEEVVEDTKEVMAWLADELEKYQANGDEHSLSPIEQNADINLRPFSGRYKLIAQPAAARPGGHMKWEGVKDKEKPSYLPIFERSGIDLSLDLNYRLTKFWESGTNIFRSLPSPAISSTSSTPASEITPVRKDTRPPTLDLRASSSSKGSSPAVSPVTVASASATWSILEWYGVHPDTPRTSLLSTRHPTPFLPVPPVPQIPASLRPPPPNPPPNMPLIPLPPIPKPSAKPSPTKETTPIRRLPVIPDRSPNSPSRSYTSPQITVPQIRTPERPPRPSVTFPLPTSSSSDPFALSPYHTPCRSSTSVRSPPAGPRPRSNTISPKQRQCSGRRPSFTISPVPDRTRRSPSPLPPTPPPPLRLGVH